MPSSEQLRVALGAFPLPLLIALAAFVVAWVACRRNARLFDAGRRESPLDAWALALGFAAAHHSLSGFTGLPPTDSIDWLPIGLLLIAAIATAGSWWGLGRFAVAAAIATVALAALALTLHGFKGYHASHTVGQRSAVLTAIALPMLAGMLALRAVAGRLRHFDFFLLTGLAGTVGAAVLFNGFNTTKLAQLLGIAVAVGGVGLVVGLLSRAGRVSGAYASAWCLLWTALAANAFLGNYELPPSPPLALLLAAPTAAALGLLISPDTDRIAAARVVGYAAALLSVGAALWLTLPAAAPGEDGPEADPDNPYADWG